MLFGPKFGLNAVAVVTLLACLPSCRQPEASKPQIPPVDTAAQKREDDFRWKERCAVAAQQFDKIFAPRPGAPQSTTETSVSEVFYSPSRNSCICEVSAVAKGGKTGIRTLLTLYDCLTREELGDTLIEIGAENSASLTDAWTKKKKALQ
jgi:hypothetical protein